MLGAQPKLGRDDCPCGEAFLPDVFDYVAFFSELRVTQFQWLRDPKKNVRLAKEAVRGAHTYVRKENDTPKVGGYGGVVRLYLRTPSPFAPPVICIKADTDIQATTQVSQEVDAIRAIQRAFDGTLRGLPWRAVHPSENGPDQGFTYIAMPAFSGSLSDIVDERHLHRSEVVNVLRQCLHAFAILQSVNLFYMDLKSPNLLYMACGDDGPVQVYLGDIGGVCTARDERGNSYPRPGDEDYGTPSYASMYWQLAALALDLYFATEKIAASLRYDKLPSLILRTTTLPMKRPVREVIKEQIMTALRSIRCVTTPAVEILLNEAMKPSPRPFSEVEQLLRTIETSMDGVEPPTLFDPFSAPFPRVVWSQFDYDRSTEPSIAVEVLSRRGERALYAVAMSRFPGRMFFGVHDFVCTDSAVHALSGRIVHGVSANAADRVREGYQRRGYQPDVTPLSAAQVTAIRLAVTRTENGLRPFSVY